MARVYALANQKGGVAKTTSTVNLGAALAERGRRVLLVDLDPQANLTMSQGFDPEKVESSMFDVLVHKVPIVDVIRQAEVAVAVSSIELAGAELALSSMIGRERALEKALVEVRDAYDFILIDTPPSLGLLTINALSAANRLIVPVQCEYYALEGLAQLLESVERIRHSLNPDLALTGLLLTMFDRRTRLSSDVEREVRTHFGPKVFESVVPRSVQIGRAHV